MAGPQAGRSTPGMDNVVRFPRDRREYEAAAAWLARLDRGLEDRERAELAAWLRKSRVNVHALVELAGVWDDLEVLSDLSALLPLEPPARPRRTRSYVVGALGAASAALACGLGLWVWLAGSVEAPASTAAVAYERTFATEIGERAVEDLPDGSRITLNTHTEMSVSLSDEERVVEMRRGEAHFSIARDVERPFGVRAAGRVVQAVGTAFNVRLEDTGGLEVIVTEGEVRVFDVGGVRRGAGRAGTLDARDPAVGTALVGGQAVRLGEGAPDAGAGPSILRLEPADLDIELAWQRGMVIFTGEPLEAVLVEFSRYTTTELVLESEELAEVRVGGYFRVGDIEGLLAALRENFHISAERVAGERVVLRAQDDR